MKTRLGFVSNSSTSSFVVFGYSAKALDHIPKQELMDKFAAGKYNTSIQKWGVDDAFIDFLYNTSFGIDGIRYLSDDGPGYIGVVLADQHSDEVCTETSEQDLDDIMSKIEKLKNALGITDKPKIYAGTRAC